MAMVHDCSRPVLVLSDAACRDQPTAWSEHAHRLAQACGRAAHNHESGNGGAQWPLFKLLGLKSC